MANRWSAKYSRERKRVTSILRELRKAGYRFNDDVIPLALPRKGRTEQALKAATLELRKYTRSKFYKQSTGRVTISGEILPVKSTPTERRRQTIEIRQQEEAPLSQTDTVLDNIQTNIQPIIDLSALEYVENAFNTLDVNDFRHFRQYQFHHDRVEIALTYLNMAIEDEGMGDEELGRQIVAQRLANNADRLGNIIERIMYDSDAKEVNYTLTEFASIIRGGALTLHESEELTSLSEML